MTPHETPEGLRRPSSFIPELEAWRGWAFLLVLLFHYIGVLGGGKADAFGEATLWTRWMAAGNTGVTLFFVLSGFLLTLPFIEEMKGARSVDRVAYFEARILRIIPLFYTLVILAFAVTQKSETLKAFLFIPIGFKAFPFSVPWWTLTTEVQFYILLPFVTLLLHSKRGRIALLVVLFVWVLGKYYLYSHPG